MGKCNFAFHLLLKANFKYFETTAKTTSQTQKVQTNIAKKNKNKYTKFKHR